MSMRLRTDSVPKSPSRATGRTMPVSRPRPDVEGTRRERYDAAPTTRLEVRCPLCRHMVGQIAWDSRIPTYSFGKLNDRSSWGGFCCARCSQAIDATNGVPQKICFHCGRGHDNPRSNFCDPCTNRICPRCHNPNAIPTKTFYHGLLPMAGRGTI